MTGISQPSLAARPCYQVSLDNAAEAVMVLDEGRRIIEWSDRAQSLFGWSAGDVLGKTLDDALLQSPEALLPPGEGERATDLNGRCIAVQARHKVGGVVAVTILLQALPELPPPQPASSVGEDANPAVQPSPQPSAGLLHRLVDNLADAVVVADSKGRILMANPAACLLFGWPHAGTPTAHTLAELALQEEDGSEIAADRHPLRLALSGTPVQQRIALVHPPHRALPVCVSINVTPLFDPDTRDLGAVALFHDISEQKRRAAMLAQQVSVLQGQAALLNLTRDAMIVRSLPEDVIAYWNPGAQRLYKFCSEEAVGQVSHELLATRFPVPLAQILSTAQQQGYWEGELTNTAADGRQLIVHSQWVLDYQEGRATRFLETNTDVTQRVQAERALRQSQQNYELLVESSTEYAIMMLSPGGRIETWNRGAETVLGYSAQEAIGQPMDMLFTLDDRRHGLPQRELERALRESRADHAGWRVRCDGSKFWEVGTTTPTFNPDGSLRGFVKILRDQTAQRLAEEQTHFLAHHDALTSLPNRIRFSDELHQAIALCERNRSRLALLLLDLDQFKHVNDTFGHHTGDLLLKEVALRIRSTLRETDFVARLGGDEFVVIQQGSTQPQAAETLAAKLLRRLGEPYLLEGREVISGASIGVALYPDDASSSVELLKRADLALYRAKHAGRHNFQFYTVALATELASREKRVQALRRALKHQQFELYYQPQIDLNSWKVSTVEALLRWHTSELDMLPPRDFLGAAEESGIIVEIGVWALRQACLQTRRWQQQGLSDLRISVNCSARQFNDPEFMAMVPRILAETGLSAPSLELEIQETLLAQRPQIREQLAALRALGIRITIDNFGTGNTALREMQGLEVDALKIDKAFVRHLPHRREDSAITSAIISLAHNLGIDVVAGGVETAEQLAYLKSRECRSAQGFIFSPPVTAEQFEELLKNENWSHLNHWPDQERRDGSRHLH